MRDRKTDPLTGPTLGDRLALNGSSTPEEINFSVDAEEPRQLREQNSHLVTFFTICSANFNILGVIKQGSQETWEA
jgi:hypothetical protein